MYWSVFFPSGEGTHTLSGLYCVNTLFYVKDIMWMWGSVSWSYTAFSLWMEKWVIEKERRQIWGGVRDAGSQLTAQFHSKHDLKWGSHSSAESTWRRSVYSAVFLLVSSRATPPRWPLNRTSATFSNSLAPTALVARLTWLAECEQSAG